MQRRHDEEVLWDATESLSKGAGILFRFQGDVRSGDEVQSLKVGTV